ncbi:MAG TPA: energy transducer TonB [Gemmatimonadales bacterium]|nr:energy transducer TonB [Gemmatimonadales bacterium]
MTPAAPLAAPAAGFPPEVGFSLLDSLIAGRPSLRRRLRDVLPAAFLGAVHLGALLAVRQVAPAAAATDALAGLETATYLDVPPPTEPESPRRLVRPRRVAVSDAVTIPAAAGDVLHPDKIAGFQELLAPKDVAMLPAPGAGDPLTAPVDARDFSGRGIVGGVAGGRPAPVLPAALAAAMALEGKLSDEMAAARRQVVPAFELGEVEIHPQLENREELARLLLAAWPVPLREAGVEGTATVQFVVGSDGAVTSGSAEVLAASHPMFGKAGLDVVRQARFTPAKSVVGGRLLAVPVVVRLPLRWSQPA